MARIDECTLRKAIIESVFGNKIFMENKSSYENIFATPIIFM
jgi:hypothetical protein